MQLLLIRHALPVRRERADGPADPELSEAGRAQAIFLAGYLASEPLTAIYSSPLLRAKQTAAPLVEGSNLPVEIIDGLAEFDRGSASYVPAEELKAANGQQWQDLLAGRHALHGFAGVEAFRATVLASMEHIITANLGGVVAVICHAGVIGSYLAHVLGIELVGPSFFAPNYTSISRVMASRRGGRSVFTMNETSHLRGTGLPTGLYD